LFGAGGNPYGTSATIGQDGKIVGDVEPAVKHQAKRTISVAQAFKNGNK
jgi:NAD(P)H dehydrogenase (quinone)